MDFRHFVTPAPSFHSRVGKPPVVPNQGNGYPYPGEQRPTAHSVLASDYFMDDTTWANTRAQDTWDYIVVGSGCTALAFITEVLKQDKSKSILCLERGDFLLPSHFQNLPLPYKMVLGGPSETFPWTLSRKTFEDKHLKYCHGSCPFFGGRSCFWSAWSPQPDVDEMRGFTEEMIAITEEPNFWEDAKALLNVTSATDIDDTIFAGLQLQIDARLKDPKSHVPSATKSFSAPLSVGRASPTSTLRFNKFSTPGVMLQEFDKRRKEHAKDPDSYGKFKIMLNCVVEGFDHDDDGVVRVIDTSRGKISWQDDRTKVILCAGAFPAATLLRNSFESCKDTVGSRVTGHFLTHIVGRVPLKTFGKWSDKRDLTDLRSGLEIAAHYLAGEDPKTKLQYHVQITAIHSPDPAQDAADAARECPDYAAAATADQLEDSTGHVVFVCATLGEFTENNKNNWFRHDPKNKDPTTNMKLQYTLAPEDRELWDIMDQATYKTIELMATPANKPASADDIEYWHDSPVNGEKGSWRKERPDVDLVRVPGIVHEASAAYIGLNDGKGASCDILGRPHGVKNVHVTGGALFPTAGSWNPTLTMCGFAQSLAKRLTKQLPQRSR